MKTRIFWFFSLLGVMASCSKDFTESPNPTIPDMVFVQVNASKSDQVSLGSFSIGKFPVTQAQWAAVMGTTVQEIAQSFGYPLAGVGDNYPMYYVSWEDAQEYIARLNVITGMNYRLPTDAEWVYAAQGGDQGKGYTYSGSNNIDDVAWYYFNIPSQVEGKPGYGVQPVGRKQPNELGIYDMSGNVWEWCDDCFDSFSLHPSEFEDNLAGTVPEFCSTRVVRGGAWDCNWGGLLFSYPFSVPPDFINYAFGFRLACSLE